MKTIIESLHDKCKNSSLTLSDVHPQNVFGNFVPMVSPIEETDVLEYICSLTDGYMESEYKLAYVNGYITKFDIDMFNCMLDTEDVECSVPFMMNSLDEVNYYLSLTASENMLYVISKEYDSTDDSTLYSLSKVYKYLG